jgi:hypothetical protein
MKRSGHLALVMPALVALVAGIHVLEQCATFAAAFHLRSAAFFTTI